LIIYPNNIFNILRIANMLNLVCKTENRKLQKNITIQINCSREKKSIKTVSSIQKIIQRDNILNYYQLNICNIEKAQIQIQNSSSI